MERMEIGTRFQEKPRMSDFYEPAENIPLLESAEPNARPRKGPKSLWTAYALWLVMGWLGAHRFYTGKWFTGILYACSFGFFFVGWALDFFLVYFMVKAANEKILRRIAETPEVYEIQEDETLAPWAGSGGVRGYLEFSTSRSSPSAPWSSRPSS
jgi:TM2 domain-containing membrane protein YozV